MSIMHSLAVRSADILADLGLKWVILGHSERRALLKESSEVRYLLVVKAKASC